LFIKSTPDDNSVTSATIADGEVTSADIGDGQVIAQDLANSAVTTGKIASGAILLSMFSVESIASELKKVCHELKLSVNTVRWSSNSLYLHPDSYLVYETFLFV
jgi:hypothetical protein